MTDAEFMARMTDDLLKGYIADMHTADTTINLYKAYENAQTQLTKLLKYKAYDILDYELPRGVSNE